MLRFDAVSYRYSRKTPPVIRSLDYEFPAGRTVLLGPNGAGKSTLMSLAVGWRKPQAGSVYRTDEQPRQAGKSKRTGGDLIGFMPQDIRYLPGLSVVEQVAYAGWLKGMWLKTARERAVILLSTLGLEDKLEVSARTLSGGQLRRVGLAMALAHEPRTLVLDEPTAGLDPSQRSTFRNLITRVTDADMIVSTHQVDDIASIYAHVVVLLAGTVVWDGTPASFLALAPEGPHQAELAFRQIMQESGHFE